MLVRSISFNQDHSPLSGIRDEPCVMLESFAVWKRALMRHGHHPDYAFDGLSIIVR